MFSPAISSNEFVGSLGNTAWAMGVAAVGGVVTMVVERLLCKIAQRFFTLDKRNNSAMYVFYVIKAVAIITGVAVACLVASKAALVVLTVREMFEAMALGFATTLLTKLIESLVDGRNRKKVGLPVEFLLVGSLAGYAGASILYLCGAAGALGGALINMKLDVNPFDQGSLDIN
ncbi:MAG: hypothetical protein H0W50_07700 [Parachlamydiaceae bacterium]|nr:hypothetical protein [Parachlamydiaceae bacterium]